jgi:3(or 17)beta-hydroxysteroid dehydrogenase
VPGRIAGKVALITGGASGLGRETAKLFIAEGARVVVTDINEKEGQKVQQELGPNVAFFRHDVTSETEWQSVVKQTVDRFGHLDILVQSAGIGLSKTVVEIELEEWRRVHAIDLDGVFLGCKHAIPAMAKSGGGSIVNISSIAGIIAGHNMAAYNTSKAGARMLAKTTALHCAKRGYNIRCNSVHPTFIDTPMVQGMIHAGGDPAERKKKLEAQVPLGHLGEPDDVAHCILHLASDESKFTTGAEFVIDGGITAQ